MNAGRIERDERTVAVENAGYRWSNMFLNFGILVVVAYRSRVRGEEAWDLMSLVVLGGVFNVAYQLIHRVWEPRSRWMLMTAVTVCIAAVMAVLIVLFGR